MMMNKLLFSEKFKTIILVVLFISTVLLAYLYLHGDTFTGLGKTVNDRLASTDFSTDEVPSPGNTISPASVSLSFGDGTFDLLCENASVVWNEFLPIYITFSEMKNLMIEEISEDQWNESMEFSSIVFNFAFDVSNDYFEGQGASNYGQTDYFTSISSIGCSDAGKTAIFVRNETQDRYFRISADSEFFDLDAMLSSLRSGTTTSGQQLSGSEATHLYYPANMLMGSLSRAFLPYQTNISMKPLYMEIARSEETDRSLAETFFGKGLNFIRKITDNSGTIMYMYGYNQKSLSITPNGNIEYTDNTTNSETQLNYNDAYKKALEFISSHGAWSSLNQNKLNYTLRKATTGTSGRATIYRFCFKASFDDFPIFGGDEFDIVIEITGDKVTYYKRNLISMPFVTLSAKTGVIEDNSEIYTLLAENYSDIAAILAEAGSQLLLQSSTYGENMEDVIEKLISVLPGYFRTNDESDHLVPVWVCRFDSCYVFFDLYSGELLGSIKAGDF